jgi:hypothetical protein
MDTRDFLLVGAGAVVGYLLVDKMNKTKAGSGVGATSLPDTSSQTVPPITRGDTNDTTGTPAPVIYGSNPSQPRPPKGQETLVDPRLTLCEENWNKYAQTMRFGSSEQAQATHDNFITSCLAKIQ